MPLQQSRYCISAGQEGDRCPNTRNFCFIGLRIGRLVIETPAEFEVKTLAEHNGFGEEKPIELI